ncbi:hypothetical protein LguiA_015765 [Lonicera macranthoides]
MHFIPRFRHKGFVGALKKLYSLIPIPGLIWRFVPLPGRVCVPIDPKHCEDFDPTTVPTLSKLLAEINMGSFRAEGDNEWDKTSLGKSVRYFRTAFLQPLLKSCKVILSDI